MKSNISNTYTGSASQYSPIAREEINVRNEKLFNSKIDNPKNSNYPLSSKNLTPNNEDNTIGSNYLIKDKKLLVLDLDETLIRATQNVQENYYNIAIKVDSGLEITTLYVKIRPGVSEFLKAMNQYYKLILFTAANKLYADVILERIDPERLISEKYYRDSCFINSNQFIKNLNIFGANLADIIMIDNCPSCFSLQRENGIPIPTWTGDQNDKNLYNLIDILIFLSNVGDVREYIPRFVIQNRIYFHNAAMIIKEGESNPNRDRLEIISPNSNSSSTNIYNTPSQNYESPSKENNFNNLNNLNIPSSAKKNYFLPLYTNEIVTFHQEYPKDDYIKRIQFEENDPKRSHTPSPKILNIMDSNNSFYHDNSSNLGLSNIYINTPSTYNNALPQNIGFPFVNNSGSPLMKMNSNARPLDNQVNQNDRLMPKTLVKPQSSYMEGINFNLNNQNKNFNRVLTNPFLNPPEDKINNNRVIIPQQMKRNILPNEFILVNQPQYQNCNNYSQFQRPTANIPRLMPYRIVPLNVYAQKNIHLLPLNYRTNNVLNGRIVNPVFIQYSKHYNK